MDVTYRCPHCDGLAHSELTPATESVTCAHCSQQWKTPAGAITQSGIRRCIVCPSNDLYVRKDFSQTAGVAIVAAGFVVSTVFWYFRMPFWTYGTLFVTALIDVALYFAVGNLLQCYRCQAQYRGVPGMEQFEAFNLETHERYRQQEARMKSVPETVPDTAKP
jgi:hypothetical protein